MDKQGDKMADINNIKNKAAFIHPQELGLDLPIWTREQQVNIARAMNGMTPKQNNQVNVKEIKERQEYMRLKEKYGK